jgi:hypothetical protein
MIDDNLEGGGYDLMYTPARPEENREHEKLQSG